MNDELTAGLTVTSISKSYGQTRALTNVSLTVPPGKVVALVGHNGAGKSTLLRALSGAERPDDGSISVGGALVEFAQPSDADKAGIACVYQELSLVDQLTVAQNMFLGHEQSRTGVLSIREMNAITDELCARFGILAHSTDIVGDIPVAQRQMIEVARAVNRGSKFILLDEPTTALEQNQVEHLLKTVRSLTTEQNIGVLLVDHKLDEVFAVADHIVGLANGRVVLDGPASSVDRKAVIEAVVGEEAAEEVEAATHRETTVTREFGPVVLEVNHLAGPRLQDISLSVRQGEILGIYGLVGSGRTRFLRTIYGAEPFTSGTVLLSGKPYAPKRPADAIRSGIAFVSEERKVDGFIPQFSAQDNVVLPVLGRFIRAGALQWRRLHASADEVLSQVSIRGDVTRSIADLSGGNQQKALFAKATLQAPLLLLLDEPTKGVDIGAKAEIYGIIQHLARELGAAVIVVSTEEEELITVADTLAVFRNGTCEDEPFVNGTLTPSDLRQAAWADAHDAA
jgi:ABC-type sugar transport system ATPase subunit